MLAMAASTIGEFWRSDRGTCEALLGLVKPIAVAVDGPLAKRAGSLLKETRGNNVLDALVVALVERIDARQLYTSDPQDMERLLGVAKQWDCEVVKV
jgi:predicted nucleic acid-binding protein